MSYTQCCMIFLCICVIVFIYSSLCNWCDALKMAFLNHWCSVDYWELPVDTVCWLVWCTQVSIINTWKCNTAQKNWSLLPLQSLLQLCFCLQLSELQGVSIPQRILTSQTLPRRNNRKYFPTAVSTDGHSGEIKALKKFLSELYYKSLNTNKICFSLTQ